MLFDNKKDKKSPYLSYIYMKNKLNIEIEEKN